MRNNKTSTTATPTITQVQEKSSNSIEYQLDDFIFIYVTNEEQ